VSDRALVAIDTPDGWVCAETTWHDDRPKPIEPWGERVGGPPTGAPFRSVVETLDFGRYTGIYRRGSDGEWTASLACWFAVEHLAGGPTRDPRGDGAVVAVGSPRDVAALRRWFRAAKAAVADAFRRGELSAVGVRRRLLAALRRRAGAREVVAGAVPADGSAGRSASR